jgi:hypothetical protein
VADADHASVRLNVASSSLSLSDPARGSCGPLSSYHGATDEIDRMACFISLHCVVVEKREMIRDTSVTSDSGEKEDEVAMAGSTNEKWR